MTGKPERTPEGWLRVPARLGRVGVLDYRKAGGGVRRELRRPEQVFDAESIRSWEGVPVTLEHPPRALDVSNAQKFQVGTVHSVRQDGRYLVGELLLTSKDAIDDVLSRRRKQISGGYRQVPLESAGEWEGERYDAEQTQIHGNHVALVRVGRSGPDVAVLNLDSEAAVETDLEGEPPEAEEEKRMPGEKVKVRFDAADLEVSPEVAEAVDRMRARHGEELKAEKARADKAEARADSAEAQVKEVAGKLEGLPAQVDAAVKARLALHAKASPILGSDFRADASDVELKRQVIGSVFKVAPSTLDGKSAEYLEARFDSAVEVHAQRNPAAEDLKNQRQDSAPAPAPINNGNALRAAYYDTVYSASARRTAKGN